METEYFYVLYFCYVCQKKAIKLQNYDDNYISSQVIRCNFFPEDSVDLLTKSVQKMILKSLFWLSVAQESNLIENYENKQDN